MPTASSRSSSHRALRARDAGLRRISRTTRTLVVGSVAATGMFASLAAWAQPGTSKVAGTTKTFTGGQLGLGAGTSAAATPTTPVTTAPAQEPSGDDDGLSQPVSVPTTTPAPAYQYVPPAPQYSPPVVVSGQS